MPDLIHSENTTPGGTAKLAGREVASIGFGAMQLRAGVEANLRTLGVEQVDVVNLRLIDELPGGQPIPADQRVDLDSQLAEMAALRDEGKIAGIGLSNASAS